MKITKTSNTKKIMDMRAKRIENPLKIDQNQLLLITERPLNLKIQMRSILKKKKIKKGGKTFITIIMSIQIKMISLP